MTMQQQLTPDFETLVELYYQPVFRFAVSLGGGLESALELTQRSFCLALERLDYLASGPNPKGWLFSLLFREFLKDARRSSRASRGALPSPEAMFYARDLSLSQVADSLGLPVDAVLERLSSGRFGKKSARRNPVRSTALVYSSTSQRSPAARVTGTLAIAA
jgi:DNA-directed RNA polymerase specialized sigma24 family protein